jgi:hypothetical protein
MGLRTNMSSVIAVCLAIACTTAYLTGCGDTNNLALESEFRNPPHESRPMTWWHWVNGNVSKEGITADMEAMKRAGLKGCLAFNVDLNLPQGPAIFMQPQWLELVDHTVTEAGRLGLEFGVHNCDGWSQAGGPWITPDKSMKVFTWTTTTVEGSRQFSERLEQPHALEDYYHDIAVIAFPTPSGGPVSGMNIYGNNTELPNLIDGNPETVANFQPSETIGHTIEFVYDAPVTVRSLAIGQYDRYQMTRTVPATLEASSDGTNFTPVSSLDLNWSYREYHEGAYTTGFAPVTAKIFRLHFQNELPMQLGEIVLSDAARVHYWEAQAGWVRKRGHGGEAQAFRNSPGPAHDLPVDNMYRINRDDIQVLRNQLGDDGRFTWDVPEGKWTIMRLGYTITGETNGPATEAGTGLECDKLDRTAVRYHFEQYLEKLLDRHDAESGKAFTIFEVDSWECGVQNWTEGLDADFQSETGYDLLTWIPLLTEGWIIDSYDSSKRMMWDWRRFLANRISEEYYGEVARFATERNMNSVVEASGRQMFMYDPIGYQRHSVTPMGEFWNAEGPGQGVRVDNRVAASTAHLTGKRYVASEAYTTQPSRADYTNHPFALKPLGDKALCDGVNQIIFHTFAHQPWTTVKPGMNMGHWGGQFHRNNTLWEPGREWIQYISRSQHMLQSGRFVADVLYYLGEDVPARLAGRDELIPPLPAGYDFDGCDFQALLDARVENGRIVLPSGMEYRVLLLPDVDYMRPHVAERIQQLGNEGAVIFGAPPVCSPSLQDGPDGDANLRTTVEDIWNSNTMGKGSVFQDMSFEQVFKALELPPDFTCQTNPGNAEILYIHRIIDNADAYFISNQQATTVQTLCRFRVTGKIPEIWDPVSGNITPLSVYTEDGHQTAVPVTLNPNGSVFIVFRKESQGRNLHEVRLNGSMIVSASATLPAPAQPLTMTYDAAGKPVAHISANGEYNFRTIDGETHNVTVSRAQTLLVIPGPWQVRFPPNLGAPEQITLDDLSPLHEHPEFGVRHFSGTASYSNTFTIPATLLANDVRAVLDLGDVKYLAEVIVNGASAGILWMPPFQTDITDLLVSGDNKLTIQVTNLWANRLIGDQHFPAIAEYKRGAPGVNISAEWPEWLLKGETVPSPRVAFAARSSHSKDDPLPPSGLIGPVQIQWMEILAIQ